MDFARKNIGESIRGSALSCEITESSHPIHFHHFIAKMIDHSLLNPTLTAEDLEKGCEIARKYDVASACILPYARNFLAQRALRIWRFSNSR